MNLMGAITFLIYFGVILLVAVLAAYKDWDDERDFGGWGHIMLVFWPLVVIVAPIALLLTGAFILGNYLRERKQHAKKVSEE